MFQHKTVLLHETIDMLQVKPGGLYVDCTLGGGGHSELILERLAGSGQLYGLDQDPDAIMHVRERFSQANNFILMQMNFKDLDKIFIGTGGQQADGFVFDLGVSSPQLDHGERGFSYHADAPLDMRMDKRQLLSAREIVNTYEESELASIILDYGEERWAKRIAQFIVQSREQNRIETTQDLVGIIKNAIPKQVRRDGGHPARKTFQALRIAVNDELNVLQEALVKAINHLNPGGRIAVITFHSLEDRVVKACFKKESSDCICPPEMPFCVCHHKASIRLVNRKPIEADHTEVDGNRRARSAKLRVVERIESNGNEE